MEWVKKKTFEDYLNEQNPNLKKSSTSYSLDSSTSFPIFFEAPSIPTSIPKTSPYKPLSLADRKAKFLGKLSDESKALWKNLEAIASMYGLDKAYPWDHKRLFRNLAIKLHPDLNKSGTAASDFISLKEVYNQYTKSLGKNLG